MRARLLGCTALVVLALAPLVARASDPGNAITPATPTATWIGGPLPGSRINGNIPGIGGVNQETHALKINVPASYYATHPLAVVRVSVSFASPADLDVSVSVPNKWTRTSNLRGGTSDQVTLLKPPAGDYSIIVRAAEPLTGTYEGKAELTDLKPGTSLAPAVASNGTAFAPTVTVNPTDVGGAEPSLAVDGDGNIFVVSPGDGVQFYRSINGGTSFEHTGNFDTDFPSNGGDSEVKVDRNGNVYIADLTIASINVQKSTDSGKTFGGATITGYEADRQWLATYGDNTVYLGYHDFTAEEELVYRSDDGGASFSQITPVEADLAMQPAHVDCAGNTFSGPVVVDQKDETIYIVYGCATTIANATSKTPPYGPGNQIFVGVSHDRGVSFTDHLVYRAPDGASINNLFPTMALDRAGNAYVAFAEEDQASGPSDVFVSYSTDKALTWHAPIKVTKTPGTREFPWIAAGDAGRVDVVWNGTSSTSPDDLGATWNIEMGQSLNLLSANPTFEITKVSDHPNHLGQICTVGILCAAGGDRSLADFIEVQVDKAGFAHVVWTDNSTGPNHLAYARQASGPSVNASAVLGRHLTQKPKPKATGAGNLPSTGSENPLAAALMLLAAAGVLGRRMWTPGRG